MKEIPADIMGAGGAKEPLRNITVDNQLLLTDAALRQLQSSVGRGLVPSRRPSEDKLPTVGTSSVVESWRALSSAVNDKELQRLRDDFKAKLLEQERFNREECLLTQENLLAEVEKVERKFGKWLYAPICELERSDIEQCYLANPQQVLTCSTIAQKFIQCVQQHRTNRVQ